MYLGVCDVIDELGEQAVGHSAVEVEVVGEQVYRRAGGGGEGGGEERCRKDEGRGNDSRYAHPSMKTYGGLACEKRVCTGMIHMSGVPLTVQGEGKSSFTGWPAVPRVESSEMGPPWVGGMSTGSTE